MKWKHAIPRVLLISIIVMSVVPVCAEELGIDVFSKVPLNSALRGLIGQLKCVITYEDMPYYCKEDTWVPDTVSGRPSSRGGLLSYTYSKDQNPKAIIQGLLQVYQEQGYPGEFTVVESDGIYNVYPEKIKDKDCNLITHVPAFETPVSISAENRKAKDVLGKAIYFASEAYAECEILPLDLPWSYPKDPPQWKFIEDIQNKSLREVLNVFVRNLNSTQEKQGELYIWNSGYTCAVEPSVNLRPGASYDPCYTLQMGRVSLPSSDKMKLYVISQRPILVALEILSARFGVRVTYEDLPFGFTYSCCPDEPIVLDGIVELDWDSNWETERILQELSNAAIQMRGLHHMFKVEETPSGYHMYPEKTIVSWDNIERPPFASVLSNEITISDTSSDDLDLLNKVCNAISDVCGIEISIMTMDAQISSKLSDKSTMITKPKGPIKAHVYLDAIITAHYPKATWRLLYEPAENKYVLDIYDRTLHPYRSAQYKYENKP